MRIRLNYLTPLLAAGAAAAAPQRTARTTRHCIQRRIVGPRLANQLRIRIVARIGAVALLDAPTTLSLVGLDASGVPSYSFHGHGCADRGIRPGNFAQHGRERDAARLEP